MDEGAEPQDSEAYHNHKAVKSTIAMGTMEHTKSLSVGGMGASQKDRKHIELRAKTHKRLGLWY